MWGEIIWRQFGAAIDTLKGVINDCPDELWEVNIWPLAGAPEGFSSFWNVTFHTLFWLDLYLEGTDIDFAPPAPFTLNELDASGKMPDRVYSKAEMLDYLLYCRNKCQQKTMNLTDEQASHMCKFSNGRERGYGELLLYTMRHVQEHAAHLSLFLGQHDVSVTGWVGTAKSDE